MNTNAAAKILAAHSVAIRDAIAARDAIESPCSPAWRDANKAASAACAAREVEIKRLAAMKWECGDVEKEVCLYGRALRRHTDPVRTTWSDLR
jgi:hypothetical protein